MLTHALHYASCVFEGERVYGGQIFKQTRAQPAPDRFGRDPRLQDPLEPGTRSSGRPTEAVRASGIADGYVRPIAWRGSEQMGVSAQLTKIHLAIAVWAMAGLFLARGALKKGIRMAWSPNGAGRRPRRRRPRAKAAGLYMICTLSKHAAEAEGYDDALMLDWRGQIAEATGANIFLGIDGELHTPKPDCFLDGITRRTVIDRARQARAAQGDRARDHARGARQGARRSSSPAPPPR